MICFANGVSISKNREKRGKYKEKRCENNFWSFDKLTFSPHIIRELLQTSDHQLQELKETYALLPATRCRRKTHCCSLLPEMTLVEALPVIRRLLEMTEGVRNPVIKKIIEYFFLNPVEITSCPFLEGQECLVYPDRFFGCRSYGLWSRARYETLAARDRKAKKHLQEQWKHLGVSLPKKVIDFQVPYCPWVETNGPIIIDDETLLKVSDRIQAISADFSFRHQWFAQRYFSDLSFLLSALMFGYTQAVQMKFTLVRDMVNTENSTKLDRIIQKLPDLCAELT
jgi:Fe-S-cluster containining protein